MLGNDGNGRGPGPDDLAGSVASAFAASATLREAAAKLLEAIGRSFGCVAGQFWELDEPAGVLRFGAIWRAADVIVPQLEARSRGWTFVRGEGLPGRVWARGEVVVVPDLSADPEFVRGAVSEEPARSAVGFPLAGAAFAGVLEFFGRKAHPPAEDFLRVGQLLGRETREFLRLVEAQGAARASEARRAAMLDAALDSIVSMDAEGRVTDWNLAAVALFGYAREEAVGQELATLIVPPRLRDRHRQGLGRYLATGVATVLNRRVEMAALRKDGTEFPVELTIARIQTDGPPAFTGYLRDISDRLRAEAEAQQEVTFREHLLDIVGHDLRNPLSAVITSATLLSRAKGLTPAQMKPVRQILASSARMKSIIENLVDYTRTRSGGELHLVLQPVDAHQLVQRIVRELQVSHGGQIVELDIQGPGEGAWDPDRLEQIISNLLSNAFKYGDGEEKVRVVSEGGPDVWTLLVTNAGAAIPEELMPRLFEPFVRGPQTPKTVKQSLGLGLYIVKQIVGAHGGTVSVSSVQGSTTFTVRLPSRRADPGG